METTRDSTIVEETSVKDLITEEMVTTAEDEHSSNVTLSESTPVSETTLNSYSTEVSSASREQIQF